MEYTLKKISFNPKENRTLTIIMGALLLGFAWQIRGMGTSDPSVVAFFFLFYLGLHYGPRKKFTLPVFGLITFAIVIMRTGWGTFVPQAGIPWVIPGYLPPNVDFAVSWWYGYFWLFIVGISWMGIPSLLFGGYLFTKQRYVLKDVLIMAILFVVTRFSVTYLVEWLIPYIAPEYYNQIYLTGISDRSFGSMSGNMSSAIAIIPVLHYVRYMKRDKLFFKNSAIAMLIFGFSLAIADVWRPISVLSKNLTTMEGWGFWEYFTGFFFGLLIFLFYNLLSGKELKETDIRPELNVSKWKPWWRFVLNSLGFYYLILYGIAESLEGSIRKTLHVLDIDNSPDTTTLKIIIGVIGISLYWLYSTGKIGKSLAQKSLSEKSIILLIALLPFHYLNFTMNRIVSGDIFLPEWKNIVVWLDTFTFILVEMYLLLLYRKYINKSESQGN